MRRLWSVLFGVAFLGFLTTASLGLQRAISENAWATFSQRLDLSRTLVEPTADVRRAIVRRVEGTPSSCSYGTDRTQLSLTLYLLRLSLKQGRAIEDLASAVPAADSAARRSIVCHPAEGGLWSTLAVIENLKGAGPDRLEALLGVSKALAPAEPYALAARSALIVRLMRRPDMRETAPFVDDLSRTLPLLSPLEGAALLAGLEAGGRQALADRLLAELPDDRRSKLLVAGGKSEAAPTGVNRFRHFDFDPFAKVVPGENAPTFAP